MARDGFLEDPAEMMLGCMGPAEDTNGSSILYSAGHAVSLQCSYTRWQQSLLAKSIHPCTGLRSIYFKNPISEAEKQQQSGPSRVSQHVEPR